MIIKTISGGHHTATAVLTEETKFVFADNWSYFHAKNLSADTAYLSMTSGGSAGDDGVIAVPGGETACIRSAPVNAVYVFAADTAVTVQIDASNTAISPFKSARNSRNETVFGLVGLTGATETPIEGIIEEVSQS